MARRTRNAGSFYLFLDAVRMATSEIFSSLKYVFFRTIAPIILTIEFIQLKCKEDIFEKIELITERALECFNYKAAQVACDPKNRT